MKRHLARMANTDQRVVVVFMQIPEREDHALVISTDNLPPRWEEVLMRVVESPEGQGDADLGNVLGRRLMPDTTDTVLAAFHHAGLLKPVPISNVIMFPEPNRPYALKQILQAMGRILPDEYEQADVLRETAKAPVSRGNPVGQHKTPVNPYAEPSETKFNPHTSNQGVQVNEGTTAIAHGLLMEADMLEADAHAKRERAYQQAPHLRPAPVVKRKTTTEPPVAAEVVKPAPKRRAAASAPAKTTKRVKTS
jgi:hypothetical protein